MQAVILAAGRGSRMGKLTENTPKPLLEIGGKSLLEYKLEALPDAVTEIVLVIGYKGEMIREKFGDSYNGRAIIYCEDNSLTGTMRALESTRSVLSGRFLVMMGDDIYSPGALRECAEYDFALVCKRAQSGQPGGRIVLDEEGNLRDFMAHQEYQKHFPDEGLIFTGLYGLTTKIFDYEPVKLETKEEWGLPQTVLKLARRNKPKIIETDFWRQISSPEDLAI